MTHVGPYTQGNGDSMVVVCVQLVRVGDSVNVEV